jgi:uncharacterized membrane protein HdeD (DUF308 family)
MAGTSTPSGKTAPPDSALSTSTLNAAKKVWATAFVRGALFLVIGLLMFFWPGIAVSLTKWLLIVLFALQAVLFGVEGARQRKDDTDAQLWRYALAAVAVAAVIALLVWPSSTIKVVLKLVAVWALISGLLGVVAALRRFRARKPAWDWELTTSLLWVIFGLMVLLKSLDNLAVVTAALSVYLTITGVVLLVAAWSLRVFKKDLAAAASGPSPGTGGAGDPGVGAANAIAASAPTAPLPTVTPPGPAPRT